MRAHVFLVFALICCFAGFSQEKIPLLDAFSFTKIVPASDMVLKIDVNPSFPNLKNQAVNRSSRIFYYDNMSLIYSNKSATMASLSWAYFTISCLQVYFELPENPDYDYCVKIAGKPLSEGVDDKYMVSMYVKPVNGKSCVIRLYFSKTERLLKMLRLDF